eukprot:scaffold301_cov243-Pinguiococcus_pyrenoidosus.AAC.101
MTPRSARQGTCHFAACGPQSRRRAQRRRPARDPGTAAPLDPCSGAAGCSPEHRAALGCSGSLVARRCARGLSKCPNSRAAIAETHSPPRLAVSINKRSATGRSWPVAS